jgi:hypothetical protein
MFTALLWAFQTMFVPTEIVLHHSASRFGTREDIDLWHRQRGFNGVGYHFIVTNGFDTSEYKYNPEHDGRVQAGRRVSEAGAHCKAKGKNNTALGVCCIGDASSKWQPEGPDYLRPGAAMFGRVTKQKYLTRKQHEALVDKLAELCKRWKIDPSKITQHSDHDPVEKAWCASLNLTILRKQVRAKL